MSNYFICYDISSDQLRLKVAKCLLSSGCGRIQKSVFLAKEFRKKELLLLRANLQALVKGKLEKEDSILCVLISPSQLEQLIWAGKPSSLHSSLNDKDFFFMI